MIYAVCALMYLVVGQVDAPPDQLVSWTQLGVAGLTLFAFISGWVVSKSTYERVLKELDRLNAKIDQRDDHMRDIILPVWVKATEALVDSSTIIRDLSRRSSTN